MRSFRSDWCEKYDWLHYNVEKDAAFCHLCMRAEAERKFLASTKREPTFIKTGFTYWKEGTAAFKKHEASSCHREAMQSLVILPSQVQGDVLELLNSDHEKEKRLNRLRYFGKF